MKSMKLWGGSFKKPTDKMVDDFNSSIRCDCRMFTEDISGSIAHVRMLGARGIIELADADKIIKGLTDILSDIQKGKVEFETSDEDIHMNIEKLLTQKIGDVGKKLHTGRSRNDQVALDIRMYLKKEIVEIKEMLKNLLSVLIELSEQHLNTIMPGYTHMQKAQPITLSHHLMAYCQMFIRDIDRLCDCYQRVNVMPLGSCALAGTTYNLDRMAVAKELGFDLITENSLDGVSDRDFVAELIFCISVNMMHLSRFCEEIILWNTNEFQFIEIDDGYSTGSSIMPQKKNPDVAELVRGKAGRVYGDLMAILTVMKGLPLAYNKDMQEDKEAVFDAVDTIKICLPVFTEMVRTMTFKKENMLQGAKGGFTNATDLADYLVKKGIAFRDAHEIVGKLVAYCLDKGMLLTDLSLDEFKNFSSLIEEDVRKAIDLYTCVEGRNITGGPAKEAVTKSIENAKIRIKQL